MALLSYFPYKLQIEVPPYLIHSLRYNPSHKCQFQLQIIELQTQCNIFISNFDFVLPLQTDKFPPHKINGTKNANKNTNFM